MTLKCIVHYKNCERYSKIKPLSDQNKTRIVEAKKVRESSTRENTRHKEQCDSIPDSFHDELHGIHLEPCYKRYRQFILI